MAGNPAGLFKLACNSANLNSVVAGRATCPSNSPGPTVIYHTCLNWSPREPLDRRRAECGQIQPVTWSLGRPLNGRFTLLPAVEFRGPHGRRVGPPGEQLNLDAHVDVNPERDSESGPLILSETGVRYQLDFLRVGVREQ